MADGDEHRLESFLQEYCKECGMCSDHPFFSPVYKSGSVELYRRWLVYLLFLYRY